MQNIKHNFLVSYYITSNIHLVLVGKKILTTLLAHIRTVLEGMIVHGLWTQFINFTQLFCHP